jgi:hypothetical protein
MFGYAGQAAMLGWLILIFLPRRWSWLTAIPRYIIPFGLSLLYAGLAMTRFFQVEGGGYGSLDEVAALLGDREMLLAGWVHYLAFDLFVGGWIAVQCDKIGINRLIQAPILLLTFMFGPVGFAIFIAIRAGHFRWAPMPEPLEGSPA